MEHLLGGAPNTAIAREAMGEPKLKVAKAEVAKAVKAVKKAMKKPVKKAVGKKNKHGKAFKKGIMKAAAAAVAFRNSFKKVIKRKLAKKQKTVLKPINPVVKHHSKVVSFHKKKKKKVARPHSIVDAVISEELKTPAGMATSLLGDQVSLSKKMPKKKVKKPVKKVQHSKLLSFVPIKPKKPITPKAAATKYQREVRHIHLTKPKAKKKKTSAVKPSAGYQAIIAKLKAKLKKQHTENEKLEAEVKEDHKAEVKKDHQVKKVLHSAVKKITVDDKALKAKSGKKKGPVMLSSILHITE
jgi:hypothetical protein